MYAVPFDNPGNVKLVTELLNVNVELPTTPVAAPPEAFNTVARYDVTGDPPFDTGAANETCIAPSDGVTTMFVAGFGGPYGVKAVDGADSAEKSDPFLACTLNT